MKLRDKLRTILPDILPQRPQDAIKGKELIARVRTVLGKEYSDGSLLSQFSALAFEEGTRLARVPGGQGYYLRREGEAPGSLKNFFTEPESADDSPLHRAIALAVRLYDTEGLSVFVFPVEEESWSHPDLVAVHWPAGQWEIDGCYRMRKESDQAPSFRAVCVCSEGDEESHRRNFFRALACGQWAHESELLLVGDHGEEDAEGLSRAAEQYGVGIRCIDTANSLLPRADIMLRMDMQEARENISNLPCRVLAHPRFCSDPCQPTSEMPDVLPVQEWAHYCVQRGFVEAFERRVAVG